MTITKARGSVWSRADNSLSDADIKTHYEANLNTNEFDDVEKSKLASVDADAEKNMTKAELDALGIDAGTVNGVHASSGYAEDATSVGIGEWALVNSEFFSSDNTAMGVGTMINITTGSECSGFGRGALEQCRDGWMNVAVGDSFRYMYRGTGNTGAGNRSGENIGVNTAAGSFTIGVEYVITVTGTTDFLVIGALNNDVGTAFTATGVGSGTGMASPITEFNTFIGFQAGFDVVAGSQNTCIGTGAKGFADMQGILQLGAGGIERLRVEDTGLYINGIQFTASGMTDAEVKTAYENNADTNEFSDAEEAKLAALKDLLPLANVWERGQRYVVGTLTDDVNVSWDLAVMPMAYLGAAGNRVMNDPTNIADGLSVILRLQHISGARTLTWGSAYHFGDEGPPTLGTVAWSVDYLTFICRGHTRLDFLGIKTGFAG